MVLGNLLKGHNSNAPGELKNVRRPAVADRFYPAVPGKLRKSVERHLRNALVSLDQTPKGIIAPHAAHVFSGPIAGSAFAPLAHKNDIQRVVLLGPAHYAAVPGLALSGATAFETPLGLVPVDKQAIEKLLSMPQVHVFEAAHAREHCLEVQLPFLQQSLPAFQIVPLLVGQAEDAEVTEVIELLWGGPETLFVVSSDLSHYLDYDAACRLDRQTAEAIEQLRPAGISDEQACGHIAVRAFLWAARHHGLCARTLDLRNSGDSSGRRERVVGYGAFAFLQSEKR